MEYTHGESDLKEVCFLVETLNFSLSHARHNFLSGFFYKFTIPRKMTKGIRLISISRYPDDQECSFSCSPRAICAQKTCLTKTLSEVFFCVGWMPFFRMCVLTVSGRSFTLYYECVTLNDCRVTLLLKSHNLSWYNLHSKYDILEALGQTMIWNEFFAWCRLCTWN